MVESSKKVAARFYDFLVIGAGSGGLGAARRAAAYGKKVAMIENRVIGGTCVNVGCVPKKVMFNLANFLEDVRVMKTYGVQHADSIKVDFPKFKEIRDAYVKRLNAIYHTNVKNAAIDYIEGTAKFLSNNEVLVEPSGERFTSEHILIASGSTPETGDFEGAEHCMNSDDIFDIVELPKSMIVIGGGYIGVEMAQIMQALGVQTTLLVRDKLLRHVDQEVVELLLENMKKLELDVQIKKPFEKVTKEEDGLYTVHLKTGSGNEVLRAEKVLLAMGRPPCVKNLKLEENTSIKLER